MDAVSTAQRRARSRVGGFTLVETMIAFVLLSFGLLAMLAMQLHAMRGGQLGRHYSNAAQIARDQMEALHRLPFGDPLLAPGGWQAPTAGIATANTIQYDGGGTTQEQVFAAQYRVTADAVDPALLKHIDVRVTWYEPNDDPAPAPPRRRYAMTSVRFND